ncbi:MAG TPA: nuclear transport factor 2 family protein [Myxococcota bacterium]|nr:nuclear transport factor 2 family protein [Myxococcota bacterium]
MAAASDLERFMGYALAFEQAFWAEAWDGLLPFFADDARHVVRAGGTLATDDRGRAAVVDGLRRSVYGIDRRFDARIPEVLDGPRTQEGGVWMRFAVTLRRVGLPELRFEGEHLTRYEGGRIVSIEEWPEAGAGERVAAYLAEHDAELRPVGAHAVPPADSQDAHDLEAALLRTLARGYACAKSEQDVGAALTVCSEDFVLETVPLGVATRDRKSAERQLAVFFAAFPDYTVTLEGVATGDGVVTGWRGDVLLGCHLSVFKGAEADEVPRAERRPSATPACRYR